MSKYKVLTGNTPPSSSGERTENKVQPSSPSAKTDNTPPSTQIMRAQSRLTTLSDKDLQHSEIARAALSHLLKVGLVKRYKVLSEDGKTVREIQIVFDPEIWTENLELKVLS